MTNLILKRGKLSRSSGEWQDQDYDVLGDGKVVGRIYGQGSALRPPELRRFWSITAGSCRQRRASRTAPPATLEEAMAKFRDNWTKPEGGG
jgi:hypothetical protein